MRAFTRRSLLLSAGAGLAAPFLTGRAEAVPFIEASFPRRGDITTGMQATVTRIATNSRWWRLPSMTVRTRR
jgi:hypothetical protein